MRIAEISAFYQYSVGKIMRDIKQYIDNKTEDACEIFYARGEKVEVKGVTKFASKISNYYNALIARVFDNDGFCSKYNTKKLIKKLKEFNPDVIHIHCLHGYYLNVELLFKYFKDNPNIKIVWTMHDVWAITGHCCYFNKANCEKWKTQCHSCPLKKEYPKSLIFDNSKRNYEKKKKFFTSLSKDQLTIVTPSIWIKGIIENSFLSKYQIINIYNGIDLDKFNLEKEELSSVVSKKKILLSVASVWDYRKGLDTIIDISSKIGPDWEIIIIGKIDKKVVLPKNITHIERTSNQQVLKQYYQSCDVFFNPTKDDNYPTVNLEAQACGAKVLTFDVGGGKETDCGNLYLYNKDINIIENINNIRDNINREVNLTKLSLYRMCNEYSLLFKNIL